MEMGQVVFPDQKGCPWTVMDIYMLSMRFLMLCRFLTGRDVSCLVSALQDRGRAASGSHPEYLWIVKTGYM